MDNTTTIAIRRDLKERIMEFASKKESYSDVIERLLKSAEQRLLHDILLNEENTISAKEALEKAKKRWRK
jgi:predicted CopG family antitoxin